MPAGRRFVAAAKPERFPIGERGHAVERAWELWSSPAEALCDAWDAVASCSSWAAAERAASAAGASQEDAAILADAVQVSRSPNMARDAWVTAVSDITRRMGDGWGQAAAWQTSDADMVVDPDLGMQMAAEAARTAMLGSVGADRCHRSFHLNDLLYKSLRPELRHVARAFTEVGGFPHRGRWYVWPPDRGARPIRWAQAPVLRSPG